MTTAREVFEQALGTYPLTFPPVRVAHVEWARFPDMVACYWSLARNDIPPAQRAFTALVASRAEGLAADAVMARAARAYPSFVRHHHALLALRERSPIVLWDQGLDHHHNIDLLVVADGGLAVGVALSTATEMATFWRAEKRHRHSTLPLSVLEVHAAPNEYQIGRFWLHDPAALMAQVEAFVERVHGARHVEAAS